MKKGLFFGFLIIVILVSGAGCEKAANEVEELDVSACEAPYYEYNDNECCLDENDNQICDLSEITPELPPVVEPVVDTTLFFYEIDDQPAETQSCDLTQISVNTACVNNFNSEEASVTVSFDNGGETTLKSIKMRVLCQSFGTKDMASKLIIGSITPGGRGNVVTADLIDNECVGGAKRLEIYPKIRNGWCRDNVILLTPPLEC